MSISATLGKSTQTRPGKWLSFSGMMVAAFNFVKLKVQRPKAIRESNIFCHAHELPLDRFIDCLVDRKLERLIRSGSASLRELGEAWERIFWEYCEQSGTQGHVNIFQAAKRAGQIETKLLAMRIAFWTLSQRYSQPAVDALKRFNCHGEFPIDNPGKYEADLKKVHGRISGVELELQMIRAEQEKIRQEQEKGKAITREDFTSQIVALSSFQGYRMNPHEVTVSEFLAIRREAERQARALELEREKLKNK